MELTHFSPKIEDLQIRAYKRPSFTVYKLLSFDMAGHYSFFFISNRKTLISTYFINVRGTHSLKLPLRLTRIFTLYVQTPIQIHSDPDNAFFHTHSFAHTHGDNALQWGSPMADGCKALTKIFIHNKKKKKIHKTVHIGRGGFFLSYFGWRWRDWAWLEANIFYFLLSCI